VTFTELGKWVLQHLHFPKLVKLFTDELLDIFSTTKLCVVNSDRSGLELLQTLESTVQCGKRPDWCGCEKRGPEYQPEELRIQIEPLGSVRLLFGVKAGHPLRCLDDIQICEGKVDSLYSKAIGQVNSYAKLQRKLSNPHCHHLVSSNMKSSSWSLLREATCLLLTIYFFSGLPSQATLRVRRKQDDSSSNCGPWRDGAEGCGGE